MRITRFHCAGYLLICLSLLTLTGCHSGFERYYVPQSLQSSYAPVTTVRVQEIGVQDLETVRKQLAPDATLVGASRFTSGNESGNQLRDFAMSIGADIVIWKKTLLSTMPYTEYTTIPHSESDRVVTRDSSGQVTERRYNYTTYEQVPHTSTIDTYLHEALFLRSPGK